MKEFPSFEEPTLVNALICFFDLTGFAATARKTADPIKMFRFMQGIAEITDNIITATNGYIVKYIGDAGLILYPDELTDEGVHALIRLQQQLHEFIKSREMNNRVSFSLHFGEIAIGKYKPFDTLDLIGDAANIAATLGRGSGNQFKGRFVMSPQVFRKLKPETRKLVHKFTPPIVYVLE